MNKIFITCLLLLNTFFLQAQNNEVEDIQIDSATKMAQHLRAEFGIAKAVYLTQVAKQLSQSFASTEQLQQQWHQALETEILEPVEFTQINTHALMAQTLITHTNGMTLNRWRMIDLPVTAVFRGINDANINAQTYSMWVNLNHHWQQLLNQNTTTNLSQWHPWLSDEMVNTDDLSTTENVTYQVLETIQDTSTEHNDIQPLLFNKISYFDPLSIALLRQNHHKNTGNLLALAYDWIEIYQLIELSSQLMTAQEQQLLTDQIELTRNHWIDNQKAVQQINEQLFKLIDSIFLALPVKFRNPDHTDTQINQDIFSLIIGVSNPKSYFDHPLRAAIQKNLEVCLNLSVPQYPEPPVPIEQTQFDSCFSEFINWGIFLAKDDGLSGNLMRLDSINSMQRALELPSIQIINNLTMQAGGDVTCQQQLSTHSNAVEWMMAAETVAWFHDRWPGMMASEINTDQIDQLINTGIEIHQYPDCVQQAQPLKNQFQTVKNKWEKLKQEIVSHIDEYKETKLTENNDVDLFKSINQTSHYVPKDFTIAACDVTQSCGAFITLEPSNELMNLFPNHLKLAEQFGLGQLEICYDNVQWNNRKTTPTHLDNNKIANFEGQLSIQLNGLFQAETVFTKTLLSEQRHIYLFGENNQKTLDRACPLPIIGKQINTQLDRGTFGLFPNRLTFLTASKTDINAVIRNNWADWQSQLNNNSNGLKYANEMVQIKNSLNDAFLVHVNELQQEIYRKLITNNQSRTRNSALTNAAFEFSAHRNLLTHMVTGLYPAEIAKRSDLHAAIYGETRLIDSDFFRQSFKSQLNVAEMMLKGDEIFTTYQKVWELNQTHENIFHSTLDQLNQIKSFSQKQNELEIKLNPEISLSITSEENVIN